MRADILVARQENCSRQYAQSLIAGGMVRLGGRVLTKPGAEIQAETQLTVAPHTQKYVSRGGLKLEAALDYYEISAENKICCDIGASTGGFTDCLLRRGATRVYAVDNGRDQLHPDLRENPRVISLERTHLKTLTCEVLGEHCDLITIDVSFISLTHALPYAKPLLRGDGCVLCLVKPQFEAGPGRFLKKGIVKDAGTRETAVRKVALCAQNLGFHVSEAMPSPITGGDGNVEFFLELTNY